VKKFGKKKVYKKTYLWKIAKAELFKKQNPMFSKKVSFFQKRIKKAAKGILILRLFLFFSKNKKNKKNKIRLSL
jgi:hypothetical protein